LIDPSYYCYYYYSKEEEQEEEENQYLLELLEGMDQSALQLCSQRQT
jgi:hypothetical protein